MRHYDGARPFFKLAWTQGLWLGDNLFWEEIVEENWVKRREFQSILTDADHRESRLPLGAVRY